MTSHSASRMRVSGTGAARTTSRPLTVSRYSGASMLSLFRTLNRRRARYVAAGGVEGFAFMTRWRPDDIERVPSTGLAVVLQLRTNAGGFAISARMYSERHATQRGPMGIPGSYIPFFMPAYHVDLDTR